MPIVASAIPEIEYVIRHHEEALLFPVNDLDDCATQLYRILHDPVFREKIGTIAGWAIEERNNAPLADQNIAFYKNY